MDKNHTLQVTIDAAAAKRGSAQFVAAVNAIKMAVRDLEKDSSGMFKSLRAATSVSVGTTKKTLDAQARSAATAQAAATRLATSVKNGMTTATGQASKLRAQFEAIGDVSGIQRTEAALAKLNATAAGAKNTTQLGVGKADFRATIAGLQGEARAQEDAAQAALKRAAATESLRKRHDEMFAVSKRYEGSLAEVAQLERTGAITAQKAGAARARAAQQLEAGAVATGKYGQALRVSQHNVASFSNEIYDLKRRSSRFDMRQVSMQLSQVGQQGQVTGNYLQALAFQLPDLALGFGPIGIAAGAVGGILATTLIGAMRDTGDEADNMKNKVHALSTTLDSLEENTSTSAAQIERHLKSAFGGVAKDVQSLIEDLRAAEFSVISREMQSEIEKATTDLNRLGGAFEIFWTDFANPGTIDAEYLKRTQNLISEAGIAYGEFQKLDAAVRKVSTAQDVTSFVSHLSEARTLAQEIGGPLGDQVASALLQAAKDGGVLNRVMGEAGSETAQAAESASRLELNIGGGANEAARLLENLNSVPSALNIMGKSVGEQIATLRAQNKSLELQGDSGLSSLAANRRVQLDAMVNAAASRGENLGAEKIGPRLAEIEALDAAVKRGQTLRKKMRQANRPESGGGVALSAERQASDQLTESIQRRLTSLKEENRVQALLRDGRYQTTEAARLAAQAMAANGGTINETTAAMIRQIDAAGQLNEKLRGAGGTSLTDSTASSLERGLERGLSDALSGKSANFATQLSNSVRASIADALSRKLVASLGLQQLFNPGATAAAVQLNTALVSGGATAATAIATAMQTGAAATATASSGGGGGLFGWISSLFVPSAAEGMVTGSGGVAAVSGQHVSPAMFMGAPHFAEGTANTSGIPAILHDNEAVVPLTRGRKIPVDLTGQTAQAGGGAVFNGGINVTVAERGKGEDDSQFSKRIAEAMQDQLAALIDTKIFQAAQYGGALNPRGGR